MGTPFWNVLSFHVNVTVGDCAIHLLVLINPKDSQDVRVYKAVLIDGGSTHHHFPDHYAVNGRDALKDAIASIEALGYLDASGNKWKVQFDTVVVTHWDEDHHGGFDLFLTDYKANQGRIPYFKYQQVSPTQWNPVTYLYAPNMAPLLRLTSKGETEKVCNGMRDEWICPGNDQCVWFRDYPPNPDPAKNNPPFAILRCEGGFKSDSWNLMQRYSVLGVNFFSNRRLNVSGGPPAEMLAHQLMANNPPEHAGQPGMYCLAVMESVLPSKATMIVKETITKTNLVSIGAAIIWPQLTAQTPCHISHIFNGDMGEDVESAIYTWIKRSSIDRVPSIKVSHHGARSSTPLTMFGTLDPSNVIIPNPSRAFFHPGWELILAAYIYSRLHSDPQNRILRLFGIQYPFYFVKVKDPNSDAVIYPILEKAKMIQYKEKVKSLDDRKGAAKDFRQWLITQYQEVNTRFAAAGSAQRELDWGTLFAIETKSLGRKKAIEELLKRTHFTWDYFGFPGADRHPVAVSSAGTFPKQQAVNSGDLVRMLIVYSAQAGAGSNDGIVLFRTYANQDFFARSEDYQAAVASSQVSPSDVNSLGADTSNISAEQWVDSIWNEKCDLWAISEKDLLIFDQGDNPNEQDDWEDMDASDDEEHPDSDINAKAVLAGPGPVLPKPKAPVPPPAATWYYFCSTVSSTKISQYATNYSTLTDTTINTFLGALHYQSWSLSKMPPAASIDLLIGSDEWATWLADSSGATSVSLLNTTSSSVGGFAIDLALVSTDPTSSGVISLSFTTDPNILASTLGIDSSYVPPAGLLPQSSNLVLAMSGAAKVPPTRGALGLLLGDLVPFVGLQSLFQGAFMSIFKMLPLVVPQDQGGCANTRNGIWFFPSNAYKTVLRLQLSLDPAAVTQLDTYLSALKLNLDPNSAYVVARKRCLWSSDAKNVNTSTQGELVLVLSATIGSLGLTLKTVVDFNPNAITVSITLEKRQDILTGLLNWLWTDVLGLGSSPFDFKDLGTKSAGSGTFTGLYFRRLTFNLNHDPTTNKATIAMVKVDMEVNLTFSSAEPIVFLVSYSYCPMQSGSVLNKNFLEADLWCGKFISHKMIFLNLT
jgi:hypothetical protein